jgi:hypothetical protein
MGLREQLLEKKLAGRSSGFGKDSPGSAASRRDSGQSDSTDQPSPLANGRKREANPTLKRKFLKRLAIALHAYGNSSTVRIDWSQSEVDHDCGSLHLKGCCFCAF